MKKLNGIALAAMLAVSMNAFAADQSGDKTTCNKADAAHCKMKKEECAKDKQCAEKDHSKCDKTAETKSCHKAA